MSKTLRHGRVWALGALVMAAASGAQAQSLVDTPWYVGAGVGVVQPESLRDLEPGAQGRVLLGIPLRPQAYLEASVFGMLPDGKGSTGKETTLGGGLDLRLMSLGERYNFLFLAGGGYSQARRSGERANAPYANIGWGVELDLGPSTALRTELRGLARFSDDFIAGRGVSYDGLLTVGLTQRFGGQQPVQAAPPPVRSATPPPPPVAPPVVATAPALPPVPPPPPTDRSDAVYAPALRALDSSRCAPTPTGLQGDTEGCLAVQRSVVPRTRLFSGESARLADDADDLLVPLAVTLLRQPDLKAEVVVHTDTLGLQSTNLDLTVNMADQIRARLLAYGVPASQMEVLGMGESEPRHNEDSEAGRARNRRVEINLSR